MDKSKQDHWKTNISDGNIEVWKIVKTPDDIWYGAKCYIPKSTYYTIDCGHEDTIALRSEKLFVEAIGEFVLDPDSNIYEFFIKESEFETIPVLDSGNVEIIYKQNNLVTSPGGLWSYKYPWQVFWPLLNKSANFKECVCPKKFIYNSTLYEYEF